MIKIPSDLRPVLHQLGHQAAATGAKAAHLLFTLACVGLIVWAAVAPFDVDPRDIRFEMLMALDTAARLLFAGAGLVGLWMIRADE